jgi:hypothetical protein
LLVEDILRMNMNYWLKLLTPGIGFVLFIGCAQIVTPSGGPKDATPPLILEMNPEPFNTNFVGNRIEIEFDEYIKLHEPSDQILISPPQKKAPDYVIKKKSLIIEFKDTLLENTTYTINFGESIRDNNEGNILGRLTYVFSTGAYLDSMQVKGKVINAEDGSAAEDVLIMLYDQDVDSLPLDTFPLYFARTDGSGKFELKNLRNTNYKIFSLKDENANYIFDLPEEGIAFLDSMITPIAGKGRPDTISSDTTSSEIVEAFADTLVSDSTVEVDIEELLELHMFIEADTIQYLKKASASGYGQLLFEYNVPVKQFRVKPLSQTLPKNWRIKEYLTERDSVILWLNKVENDSLQLLVQADQGKIDTVELALIKMDTSAVKVATSSKKERGKKLKNDRMVINFGGAGKSPKPGQSFTLTTSHPVALVNIDSISILQDSVPIPFRLKLIDSTLRRFEFVFDRIPDMNYKVELLPDAFINLNTQSNKDTISTEFRAARYDEFGNLDLVLSLSATMPIVIQVLNQAERIVFQKSLKTSGTFAVETLSPGKYSLKAIFDANGNGKWDTGRYSLSQQPEKAIFYSTEIEIRPNWDMETEWDLFPVSKEP